MNHNDARHSVMNWFRTTAALAVAVIGFLAVSSRATARAAEDVSANAALQYWLAFQSMPNVQEPKIWNATTDDKTFGFGVPVSEEAAKAFQSPGGKQSLTHLHRGAALRFCEWGTDVRKDGLFASATPYANKARHLSRLSMLRARWYFEHNEWDKGIDDVIATMTMARHSTRGMLPADHYCYMTENICLGTAAAYLPRMPKEAREKFSQRLDGLPTLAPMRDALLRWEHMADWLGDNLRQAQSEGRLSEFLADFAIPDDATAALRAVDDPDRFATHAKEARPLLRACADLISLTPEECDRVFKEKFEAQLKKNPITAALALDYPFERREDAQADCRKRMMKAGIDIVDRGKTALNDHPDPYGEGPFEYIPFDGGFELRSRLHNISQVNLTIGLRKK